jgi:hypothetical protein
MHLYPTRAGKNARYMLLKTIVDGYIGAMVSHWWKHNKKETGSDEAFVWTTWLKPVIPI